MLKKIGKYEIRSMLGEGGTGVVYEGFDPIIERRVAVKLLHPSLIDSKHGDEALQRFKREAISAARCVHPNVVTLIDYDIDGDTPFIVMEYVAGYSLQKVISRKKAISLKSTLSVVKQLLRALNAAHQLNIVHRDITAGNVLVLKDSGRIKLADFGMAKTVASPDVTQIGTIVGTPRYMAPEQLFGMEADARADIFSTTRLFLELLTLLPRNSGLRCSHLPEIAGLPPNNRVDYSILYPTALIPLLVKGLSVKAENRFQNAAEFMQALDAVMPSRRRGSSAVGKKSRSVVQKSTQEFPIGSDELESITSLLADYVGPIAKVIVDGQDITGTSAKDLVTQVSRDIPESGQRVEFLKQWIRINENSEAAQRTRASRKATVTSNMPAFADEILNRIGRDYADYVGPVAFQLLDEYSRKSNNIQQLVKSLANEIPNVKTRQAFIDSWENV